MGGAAPSRPFLLALVVFILDKVALVTHIGVRLGDDVLAELVKTTAGRKVPSLCSFVRTAADWAREVGEGRTRPLVRGGRVDAPLARNRFTGWPGRRNDPLCPPPFLDRSRPPCGAARALGRSPARRFLGDDRTALCGLHRRRDGRTRRARLPPHDDAGDSDAARGGEGLTNGRERD
jgi:hypothetical protein